MKTPYTLYKSDISYFSGKLEAYLRYKGVEHKTVDVDRHTMDRIAEITGIKKMPAIESSDGLWLFDTTPTIQWLEDQFPTPSVVPDDPALKFIALLIEDYGDEWLWRPAMWWRWMPRISSWSLGRYIAHEYFPRIFAAPAGWYFARRQRKEWLWDDGMTKENSDQIRDMFHDELAFMEQILEQQPFFLGSHPSLADFGYFGSMFRHFGNDYDPAHVIRNTAPNTHEWLGRLWNTKPHKLPEKQEWLWPEPELWSPLLKRIGDDYLPYLHQNAMAFKADAERFDYKSKNFELNNSKTTNYRVWCRENLQRAFAELGDADKERVTSLFTQAGTSLDALHLDGAVESGLDNQFVLPLDPSNRTKIEISLEHKLFGRPRN